MLYPEWRVNYLIAKNACKYKWDTNYYTVQWWRCMQYTLISMQPILRKNPVIFHGSRSFYALLYEYYTIDLEFELYVEFSRARVFSPHQMEFNLLNPI